MSIALCMLVKDEINRIADCLDPIIGLVDQAVIIDTGSTDGTLQLLAGRYGIVPMSGSLDAEPCFGKSNLRNRMFAMAETSWILALDADERLDTGALQAFERRQHDPSVAGYFGAWLNHPEGEPDLEDYMLFLFRKGFSARGLVHENVQRDVRGHGERAYWLDGLVVNHYPEAAKMPAKFDLYRRRLECAIRADPSWMRYYWFSGYMEFQRGRLADAIGHLSLVAGSQSCDFPVECLNSHMVLAEIHARSARTREAISSIESALAFYDRVCGDFEVQVNFRMKPWLERALAACRAGDLQAVRAYRFAR